jgi:hypothetical protein
LVLSYLWDIAEIRALKYFFSEPIFFFLEVIIPDCACRLESSL